ncbi:MAG: glycosyltransferase family 39 protein [Bdellovibrionales bacterium]|nr:glycosyltransferase family 39 protein [Bdellovibrionales bacterium]
MRRGLFATLALAVVLYLILVSQLIFKFPWPWPDESLYADIARNFLETGKLGIPFFEGYFTGIEAHQHFYPPFYFLVLALIFKIFPYGLLTLRLSSLAFMLGACLVTLAGARRWLRVEWLALFVGGLVLLFDPVFIRGSLIGRMDALGILLSILSLWLLHFAEVEGGLRQRSWAFAGSGVLAGLAFLTHPMTWAAPLTLALYLGLLVVLRRIGWKPVALVAVGGVLITAPYFVWLIGEWPFFTEQFAAQMVRKRLASPHGFYAGLKAFEALFRQYEILKGLGLLSFVLGLAGLILGSLRDYRLIKFLVFHLAVTVLATYSREMWYPLYWTVTSALGIVLLTSEVYQRRVTLRWCSLLLSAAALSSFVWFLTHKTAQLSGFHYSEYCKTVREIVPPRSVVYLSSLPDAYFCFSGKEVAFHQFVPALIPVPQERAFAIMDRASSFIGGDEWIGEHLDAYLTAHASEFEIHEVTAGGFKLKVFNRRTGGTNP